jgi:DNA-directed RNA polymerase subunit M/transcription elongation factor TFIIS
VDDLSEARRVKRILDDAGIPCYLGPDNLENVEELQSNPKDGVDLKVRAVDNQPAMQALSRLPTLEPDEDKEYLALCPKCHSAEIVFQSLDAAQGANSDTESKFHWSCDACGCRWRDDGIEQEA